MTRLGRGICDIFIKECVKKESKNSSLNIRTVSRFHKELFIVEIIMSVNLQKLKSKERWQFQIGTVFLKLAK